MGRAWSISLTPEHAQKQPPGRAGNQDGQSSAAACTLGHTGRACRQGTMWYTVFSSGSSRDQHSVEANMMSTHCNDWDQSRTDWGATTFLADMSTQADLLMCRRVVQTLVVGNFTIWEVPRGLRKEGSVGARVLMSIDFLSR